MSDETPQTRRRPGRPRKIEAAPDENEGAFQETGRTDPAQQDQLSADPAVEDDVDDPRQMPDPDSRRRPQVHSSRESEIPSSYPAHGLPDDEMDIPWQEPTKLDAPPARPGYVQRWVFVQNADGSLNSANWSRRQREGWRPRQPNTVPGGYHAPTMNNGQYAGLIGVEGSILCEMPESRDRQRRRFYASKQKRMDEAIALDLNRVSGDSGIPIDRRAKTRVTTGRRPQAAPDRDMDAAD